MIKQVFSYLILMLVVAGCSFSTVFDTLSFNSDPPPNVPTIVPTQISSEDVNCYEPVFLSDRGIRIGNQAVIKSAGISALSLSEASVELYFDHPSSIPDVILSDGDTVTILDGPFCFATRNGQNRSWQVRVNESGLVGYIDEYSTYVRILNVYLHSFDEDNHSMAIRHFAVSIASAFGRPANMEETVYISWDVGNASDVSVIRSDTGKIVGSGLSDSVPFVVPSKDRSSIDFILIATNADGQQLEEVQTLLIDCGDCQSTDDTSIQTNITAVPVSYIQFERGFMLYRTDTYEIYVLHNDKIVQTFADTWQGETYTDDAPTGYFTPQLGFGNIWTNTAGVRDALGWATSLEIYDGSNLVVSKTSEVEIHLPNTQTIVINNGSWHYKID